MASLELKLDGYKTRDWCFASGISLQSQGAVANLTCFRGLCTGLYHGSGSSKRKVFEGEVHTQIGFFD